MHYNCLIIDDENPLAESTTEYFNLFSVTTAAVPDAKACLSFLQTNTVDIILLDINLEHSSGFDLCRTLRQTTQIPILFISARQSDDDILVALNIGGDDYIRKPYSLSVLLAKVKVVLKRFGTDSESPKHYKKGKLSIEYDAGRVTICEELIKLKAMEYKLLCYLIQHPNCVLPKEELFSQVWGTTATGDGTLNVHIRHLREKIELNPNEPSIIQTIWGIGYLFEEANL